MCMHCTCGCVVLCTCQVHLWCTGKGLALVYSVLKGKYSDSAQKLNKARKVGFEHGVL